LCVTGLVPQLANKNTNAKTDSLQVWDFIIICSLVLQAERISKICNILAGVGRTLCSPC
jgi:hypothetical protein